MADGRAIEENTPQQKKDYQALVEEITERVWKLWQQELRHERERRAKQQKD